MRTRPGRERPQHDSLLFPCGGTLGKQKHPKVQVPSALRAQASSPRCTLLVP